VTAPLRLQVFVSSPSDVAGEREVCRRVVQELQRDKLRAKSFDIETYFWEDDSFPDMAEDAQAVVNETLFDADREAYAFRIVICLLWTRFGTPTRFALSGTAEEVIRCLLDPNVERSRVLLYVSDLPLPPSRVDAGQLENVRRFLESFQSAGGLYSVLTPADPFEATLRQHLREAVDACGASATRGRSPAPAPSAHWPIPLTDNLKDYARRLIAELDRLAALAEDDLHQILALLSACAGLSLGASSAGTGTDRGRLERHLRTFLEDVERRLAYTPLETAPAALRAARVWIAFGRVLTAVLQAMHGEMMAAARRLLDRLKPLIETVLSFRSSVIVNWPAAFPIPDGSLLARIRADADAMRALESWQQALEATLKHAQAATPGADDRKRR
jgi:hypothetical protein